MRNDDPGGLSRTGVAHPAVRDLYQLGNTTAGRHEKKYALPVVAPWPARGNQLSPRRVRYARRLLPVPGPYREQKSR